MTSNDVEKMIAVSDKFIDENINVIDRLDSEGYPTPEALDIIKEWSYNRDSSELFEFIKSIWWMPEWGWKESLEKSEILDDKNVYRYYISTGGWSGNESIIDAMNENKWLLWSFIWVQSRRGGHYIFERRLGDEDLQTGSCESGTTS